MPSCLTGSMFQCEEPEVVHQGLRDVPDLLFSGSRTPEKCRGDLKAPGLFVRRCPPHGFLAPAKLPGGPGRGGVERIDRDSGGSEAAPEELLVRHAAARQRAPDV